MQNLFGFVIHPMELGLIMLCVAVGSAGIGIIAFTILVRLVLAPLQIVQLRSAKAMQRLQPLMTELRQKHGKDREKLSQATMALYKEHKVNPAMGCLPSLLQMPILFGLFYALLHLGDQKPSTFPIGSKAVTCNGHVIHSAAAWLSSCYAISGAGSTPARVYELFHANFLWLSHGLGQHDPLYILPVLAGITQWVSSRMMLTKSTDQQQQMMNSLMNFMPLMIVFFATKYASGLSLYWVSSTLIGIAIQYRITGWGLLPKPAEVFAALGGGGARRTPKASGFIKGENGSKAPTQNRAKQGTIAATPEVVDGDLSEQNGSEEQGRQRTAAIEPRRKANRAKGGRRGGRRG